MLNFLFILLLSGCAMTNKKLEKARFEIGASNCLKALENKLKNSHCTRLVVSRTKQDMTVRCLKVDRYRRDFWDTWWFRISPSSLKIHPTQVEEVEQHTICHDGNVRIEAYPPEKTK